MATSSLHEVRKQSWQLRLHFRTNRVAFGLLAALEQWGCKRTDLNSNFGSGTGIRTLNLAVNSSLRPVQKWRLELRE